MALMSQPVSHSETLQCKTRCNGVNMIAHAMGVGKSKQIVFPACAPSRGSLKAIASWSLDRKEAGRGHRTVVAASPPTEDAVIATEPLTKQDLVDYLASGCKPKTKWRIGTEHEKFGFEMDTLRPMKYEQIAELLNGISERFDWDK